MNSKIHTVIFDLDGTLSDSAVLTMAAFERVAPVYGLPVPSLEAVRGAMGHANPEFYYILFPDFPRDMVYDMGNSVELEELRVLPSVGGRLLFKGCRELIACLKEHGVQLYIASTGDREHVFSVLSETGIIGFFDKICCGRSDKIEMLREITEDGDKDGYLMVGDMGKDHDGARANGILSVGACYGYCKRELTDFDFYIDEPFELLSYCTFKNPD